MATVPPIEHGPHEGDLRRVPLADVSIEIICKFPQSCIQHGLY